MNFQGKVGATVNMVILAGRKFGYGSLNFIWLWKMRKKCVSEAWEEIAVIKEDHGLALVD